MAFIIFLDTLACPTLLLVSFYIRDENLFVNISDFFVISIVSICIMIPLLYLFKLHTELLRYSNFNKFVLPAKAISIYTCLFFISIIMLDMPNIPRSIAILQPILYFIYYVISRRTLFKLVNFYINNDQIKGIKKKVLLFGTDTQLISISNIINESNQFSLIGFIEKNKQMIGRNINGFPIFNIKNIEQIILNKEIDMVVISPVRLNKNERYDLIARMVSINVSITTPENLWNIVYKKQEFFKDEAFDIYDLVGRKQIKPVKKLLEQNVKGKVILVTGAGGSIGKQLTLEIMKLSPKRIIALDNNEFSLYNIENLINDYFSEQIIQDKFITVNASVTDVRRLESIIKHYKPSIIYHAAALKHVPMVENNPGEAIKVNVKGTINLVNLSIKYNISNFVFVSTDKAVRPTNIMGATKRISEQIIQDISTKIKSVNFTIVRFGNVIDSSGSVIPKFKAQIKNNGPITLTHPNVTRFFMTIPEAAQLIIQASAISKSGGMYVLDMGKPVKIYTVAKRLIQLSGLKLKDKQNPLGDISIKIIGLRQGEKMYEELIFSGSLKDTSHQSIRLIEEDFIPSNKIENTLDHIIDASEVFDFNMVKKLLKKIVPDYKSMY